MSAVSARSIRRFPLYGARNFTPYQERVQDRDDEGQPKGRPYIVHRVDSLSRGERKERRNDRLVAAVEKVRAAEEKAKRRQAGRDLIAALKAAGLPCPGHPDHVRLAS
jgi:hypothetical protein